MNDEKLQNTVTPSYNTSDHVTVRLPPSNNANLVYVKRGADDDVIRRSVPSQMMSDDSTQLPVQYFVLDQAQVDRERPVDFQYWLLVIVDKLPYSCKLYIDVWYRCGLFDSVTSYAKSFYLE